MKGSNWEVGSTWYTDFDFELNSLLVNSSNSIIIDYLKSKYSDYGEKINFISTCRSGLELILDSLDGSVDNKVALVPGFTCKSVILPFIKRGYNIYGYSVNDDLSINRESFLNAITELKPGVILLHGYFGFDTLVDIEDIVSFAILLGSFIIKDYTQTLFSDIQDLDAHFKTGSLRKWFPIPDGAFITGCHYSILDDDNELAKKKIIAFNEKEKYISKNIGTKEGIMILSREAETLLDSRSEPYLISRHSLSFLFHVDFDNFKRTRIQNYSYLASRLEVHHDLQVIFPEVPKGVVPFMLPILVRSNRDRFQHFMAQNNVYPTVIWAKPEDFTRILDFGTEDIYDTILCFHIDQRYDLSDMMRVGDIVDDYFNLYEGK